MAEPENKAMPSDANLSSPDLPEQSTNHSSGQQSVTTVIINQPQQQHSLLIGNVTGHRPWTTGLFDCCSDKRNCCFTSCCYACAVGNIESRIGECYCTTCFVIGAEVTIRTRIRTLGGIQGSMCKDCLAVYFCPLCAACQEARELNNMGVP